MAFLKPTWSCYYIYLDRDANTSPVNGQVEGILRDMQCVVGKDCGIGELFLDAWQSLLVDLPQRERPSVIDRRGKAAEGGDDVADGGVVLRSGREVDI